MKSRSLFIPVFIIAAAGFTQTTQTLNFQVAGKARSCVIHVPSGTSTPAIVFFLHGAGGNGAGFENDTKADAVADREKFIAAYPSAISGNWDYSDGSSDFTFMLALIDTIDARHHIDRNKVYVTGFSMGGGMTFALACTYADVFAAIAPVSAAGSVCTPSRPIPVLLTFGTKDMSPPANYMTAVNRWVGIDGCPSTPIVTRPYPATNTQSVVTRITYGPCSQGTEVIADSIQGGPHEWPMDTKTKVNNSEEVWAFFKKFSLDKTAIFPRQPAARAHDHSTVSYSAGIIRLHGLGETARVSVIDTKGRLVANAIEAQSLCAFKDKPSGVYILLVNGKDGFFPLRMVIPDTYR